MDQSAKILVVEDELEMLETIDWYLKNAGFSVTVFSEGQQALNAVEASNFDLAILDINLPDIDGLSLTRLLKAQSNIGIIILSGRGETSDRILGLEYGADDYLAKPFELRELLARVRSVLRRLNEKAKVSTNGEKTYSFGEWTINETMRTLSGREGEIIELPRGEFDLLLMFVRHPKRPLTRNQILDLLGKTGGEGFDRSIDSAISRLRQKMELDTKNPEYIKTIQGVGYLLSAEVRIL